MFKEPDMYSRMYSGQHGTVVELSPGNQEVMCSNPTSIQENADSEISCPSMLFLSDNTDAIILFV